MSIFDHAAFSRGSFSARAQSIETRVRVGPVVRFSPSFYRVVKRNVDVVVSLIALIVLSLPAAVIAVLIAWKCQGPVLSTQTMVGRNGVLFNLFTFRSVSAPAMGMSESSQTRAGDVLRVTGLYIIPQFFNVLRGDMSLVGPRPHAIGMKTGETESALLVAEYAHRHRIKPGMTGWAAINGSRGPMHTAAEVRRRVQLDIDYIERQSFWLDLWVIAVTVPVLLGDRISVR